MMSQKPTGKTFRYIDIDSIDNKNQRVTEPKITNTADAPSRASRHLQYGDTVFSLVRPYLKNIAFIDESLSDCIGSTGFYVCRPHKGINPFYVYHLMTSPYVVDGLNTFMKGDNSPSIRGENIETFAYPIPPLAEQKRIVDRIESLFSKFDGAKAKLEDALSRFETRKAAVLHKAATGELTVQWRMDNNIVFSSWSHRPLKEICERIFDGPFGSNLKSDDYVDSGIRVVRLENLKSLWFDDSKQSFVTEQKYESIKSHTVFPSDIIMSTFIADETKVCEMPPHIPFAVNKADCIGIRLNGENCKRFILYYLASPDVYKTLFSQIHGATRPRVNTTQIKEISVPIPSIEEQEEIVRILDAFFERENAVRKTIEERLAKIELYKKAILAKAFRGELGTNDPSDEPATELLKKILA